MIEVSHINKSFGDNIHVLKDVSFEVGEGEFAFLVGSSGAGKTTLMNIMFRELLPSSGEGRIVGFQLLKITSRNIHRFRRKIGFVFQDSRLLMDRTVFENISFVLRAFGYGKSERYSRTLEVIKMVGLEKKQHMQSSFLSGGEQQKVAIARAIVNRPSLILADEPTGNLDSEGTIRVMDIFHNVISKGTTVLIATHNLDLVRFMKKRTFLLQDGIVRIYNS